MLDYDTGSGDSMEILQQHPFMTENKSALNTDDEMIHRVHITDTDIVLGSREGNIFVVDLRTLKRRELIEVEKCHSCIRCISSYDQMIAVSGQEGKMSIWRLDSQNNQCIRTKVLDCLNQSVIKCLRMNKTFLVTYATDNMLRIYKWSSSSTSVREGMTEEPQMSSESGTVLASTDVILEDYLRPHGEVRTHTGPHSHSMVLQGHNLLFVDGSCLLHYKLEPDNADQPVRISEMDFKDDRLLCLAPSTTANSNSESKESERHIWIGTKQPGKIMMLDLRTKEVIVEIKVFEEGHMRQILPVGKHLMCVVQDPRTTFLSCLCYEIEDLQASQSALNPQVQFRKVVDFGKMSSEICHKGDSHLFYYRKGTFCHRNMKEIAGIPQRTCLHV